MFGWSKHQLTNYTFVTHRLVGCEGTRCSWFAFRVHGCFGLFCGLHVMKVLLVFAVQMFQRVVVVPPVIADANGGCMLAVLALKDVHGFLKQKEK